MLKNAFNFGNQGKLHFSLILLLWIFFTPQLFTYNSFRIFYFFKRFEGMLPWISFIFLSKCISEIYAGLLSLSSFLYRGSLQTSFWTWSKITIKQRLLSTKNFHVLYFYWMKVENCSKELHSLTLIWYSASTYYVTVIRYCYRV
jgi:hypothetical protein